MEHQVARQVRCELKGHEFVDEDELFHDHPIPIVNYRELCIHCGGYNVLELGVSPMRSTFFKGPDGRMPAYWAKMK